MQRNNDNKAKEAENKKLTSRMLLGSFPGEVVVINTEGKIVYANDDFYERYNTVEKAAIGKPLEEIERESSLPLLLQSNQRAHLIFSKNSYICIQGNLMRDSKTFGAVQLSFSEDDIIHIQDEQTYGSLRDITTVFESNWDVTYVSDGQGITLDVSSASKEIWGVEKGDLIGRSVYDIEREGLYSPSITRMVLESGRRVQALQCTSTGKKLLVLGTPIKNDKGEIVRVINTSRMLLDETELIEELDSVKLLLDGYRHELAALRMQEHHSNGFVFHSAEMRNIKQLAFKVAQTDIAVLLSGESGVGKEVVASYIHTNSLRKEKPYIKINCGAIPESLFESELFGYEKGAFTGAEKSGKPGVFELANGGTLFLDEVGEIPLPLQVKLLRVLQEGELMRVGGTKTVKVDVRIIAATNKNLIDEVEKKEFRRDLYYRLSVVPILIPPLRDRKDDIMPLTLLFLQRYNEKYETNKRIGNDVIEAFQNSDWNGNIRELQNTVERLVVLTEGDTISVKDLPDIYSKRDFSEDIEVNRIIPLNQAVAIVEQKLMEMARKKYKTTTKIAEALGIDQSTVSRKLKKLN